VITIGRYLAAEPLTVTISGVTVKGGVARTNPESADFGKEGVIASGGGIAVSPTADFGPGATVTIKDSVVAHNRAAPTATIDSGLPCPGGGDCPFARARGGGIDSYGPLTLRNTTVRDNVAGGVASDAVGGGISVWDTGSLTLWSSHVDGNEAIAAPPTGRFAEGGGIFVNDGVKLAIHGGSADRNDVTLISDFGYFVPGAEPLDSNANGGGIHAGTDGDLSIDGTSISGNSVTVRNPNGRAIGFDSALMTGSGPLDLRNARIRGNRLYARVASSEVVGYSGAAVDLYGPTTVSHTELTGNRSTVESRDGLAAAGAGAVYVGEGTETALIADSEIAGNSISASSGGQATVQGAGLVNDGQLRLVRVRVHGNTGKAHAPAGFAHGGGIFNGRIFNENGPIELALARTTVTGNRVAGGAGVDVAGGGIFTESPFQLSDSPIFGNSPDGCRGC
jgi:hypothetical protein